MMIRVRLADPTDRGALAKFMTFSNLVVRDDGTEALLIDFARFDLDESAQLRIVQRLVAVWEGTRDRKVLTEIEMVSS
jgi:hypothetical protein